MATLNVPTGLLKTILLKEASRAPLSAITFMKKLSKETEGIWQPSPGSIYYLTNELESKGCLKKLAVENERYPKYIITSKGKEELENLVEGSNRDVVKLITILKLYCNTLENKILSEELEKLHRILAEKSCQRGSASLFPSDQSF
ncbi:MAG: PadR family transcriptional regulator [Nitrososphaeria archaeon]